MLMASELYIDLVFHMENEKGDCLEDNSAERLGNMGVSIPEPNSIIFYSKGFQNLGLY